VLASYTVVLLFSVEAERARRSGGEVGLAGTAAGALARDDDAVDDELATPDAPGLAPVERTGQARLPERAGNTQGLGVLDGLG